MPVPALGTWIYGPNGLIVIVKWVDGDSVALDVICHPKDVPVELKNPSVEQFLKMAGKSKIHRPVWEQRRAAMPKPLSPEHSSDKFTFHEDKWVEGIAGAFWEFRCDLGLSLPYVVELAADFLNAVHGIGDEEEILHKCVPLFAGKLALDPERAREIVEPVVEKLLAMRKNPPTKPRN